MVKKGFPSVHFYDQDFVDLYEKTWAWLQDSWKNGNSKNGFPKIYFNYPENDTVNQFESILATFFLVYSNNQFPACPSLDLFYSKQEDNGAIRGCYSEETGRHAIDGDNPEGVQPPLFSWAEYNLYHKEGNKKRLKEIVVHLEKYYLWIEKTFMRENGLYHVPVKALMMENAPRPNLYYPVDFNSQQAVNALYMSEIGDILNDKEMSFKYKRKYFSLKTRISSLMWNDNDGFYYDLDENEQQIRVKTIATFWTMLAEIPNEERANKLVDHLKDPESFGTDNPFPSLAASEPEFSEDGDGCRGSVFAPFTYMVIKGLEKYARYELARECSIRHLYFMLDTLHPEGSEKGNIYEAYKPNSDGPAVCASIVNFPRPVFLAYTSIATITMVMENIIGLYISLPRKTVDWIMPTLEIMGIENLSLKRNFITILSNKSGRGWEIRLESEKLYYFTINILDEHKKKTLPIPSGKCSMLIDKL